jgi:hypothetical protein
LKFGALLEIWVRAARNLGARRRARKAHHSNSSGAPEFETLMDTPLLGVLLKLLEAEVTARRTLGVP